MSSVVQKKHNDNIFEEIANKATGPHIDRMESLVPFQEDREKIAKIFSLAAIHGDNLVKENLTAQKFRALAKQCRLIREPVTNSHVDVAFANVTKGHPLMDFFQFLEAILAIGKQLDLSVSPPMGSSSSSSSSIMSHGKLSADDETKLMGQLLEEFIFPNCPTDRLPDWQDPEVLESKADDVLDYFDLYRKPLHKIFNYYAALDQPDAGELSWEEVQDANEEINLTEFMVFCKDYKVFPGQFSKIDISKVFRAANLGPSGDDNPSDLCYDEFLDIIARMSFGFFGKPAMEAKYPSRVDKIRAYMQLMDPLYIAQFGVSFEDEKLPPSDKSKLVPIVSHVGPSTCSADGGITVSITGSQFDPSRIVVCCFGDIKVPAVSVKAYEAKCVVPPQKTEKTVVEAFYDGTKFQMEVSHVLEVLLRCSNDGKNFSTQETRFLYKDIMPRIELGDGMRTNLRKMFISYCSYRDAYNTDNLYLDKWIMFCRDFEIAPQADDAALETAFQEHASIQNGSESFSLNFKDFLRSLFILMDNQAPGVDPCEAITQSLEAHQDMATLKKSAKKADEDQSELLMEIDGVETRHARMYDLFCGPVLVACLEERPGQLLVLRNAAARGKRHKFLHLIQYDGNTEDAILAHVNVAESFDHLVQRLRDAGFDFACARAPETRRPVGRCWTICNDKKERVGALFDYEGQICNQQWQPRLGEVENKKFSLTAYTPHKHRTFLDLYRAYRSPLNTRIDHLRNMLHQRGFTLLTKLYSPSR